MKSNEARLVYENSHSTEMAELHRLLIEDYGIELRIMMENAGRTLARRLQESLG